MKRNCGQRRVLLVVPRITRDLESHALIAYHLRQRFGHDVQLWTGAGTDARFLEYAPDALVLDVVGYEDRLNEAKLARVAGVRVCVLPTSGVFPDEQGFLRLAGAANGGCSFVDCYLSWGEFAANAIVSEHILEKERVEITGCPRFDFYADKKLAGIVDRKSFRRGMGIEDTEAPVILWCTNTGNYNNRNRNVEKYIEDVAANAGFHEPQLRIEIEDERKQLESHSRVVLELARRYAAWNFVVKIHPLEDRKVYVEWARQSKNIFIAPNLPFRAFVFHCDILLQRGCTTATEFWTQGKPVLELQMGDFQTVWAPREHTDGNHLVFTLDEAASAIAYYLHGGSITSDLLAARRAYLEKFYYRIDGLSALRCANRIHREITGTGYTDEHHRETWKRVEELRIVRAKDCQRHGIARIKHGLKLPPHRTLRVWKGSFWRPSPRIDQDLLAQLYKRFSSVSFLAETA